MPITDLTGTTWRFNDELIISQSFLVNIYFTANNGNYTSLMGAPISMDSYLLTYGPQTGSSVQVYNTNNGGWDTTGGADYRTIVISEDQHGQTGVTNSAFITWLEANAVQVIPGVTISYDGDTIATMEESGTKTLQTAGKYCDGDIEVKYTEPTPSLQNKTVYPATTSQSVTADSGYDGLGTVTVNAMPSGIAGTPTATKGTVSNHSVSVTPSVTNTPGYITGGTKTGTAVTVSASELVSGTLSITSSGTTDVTNYASASVAAGSAKTPGTMIAVLPTLTLDNEEGIVDANNYKVQSVTPTVTAGYVSSGTAGNITVTGQTNILLPTKDAQTYTPTTTNQTIAQYQWLTGAQTILGDANLVAGNIKKDVSIFNVTGTYEGSGGGGGGDLAGLIQRTITSASDSTVTKIGMCAFYSCYSLVTISFPNCSLIESSAFYTCSSLIAASFPKCQSIGQAAFSSCRSLGLAYFPSCSWVGSYAFRWCRQLSEISFPLCSVLHNYAFDSCAITTASFPACTLLNSAVFYECSHLSSIYFPICTTVGSQAFRSCAITTAFFPECRSISASAFGVCKELVVASFPRCSRIYSYAFQSCFHLLSLYLLGTSVPTLSLNVFASTPIFNYTASTGGVYGSIFVKASLLASFQTATNWSVLSARMVGLTDEQIAAL